MIRQYGIPTWFLTVSAADMQWPDLIQTIARQYGQVLSDEDVKNLSFDQRSMWLRSNPVTAARHFHYRLELLFNDILKSKARPLGELMDYVIRIEFQARGSPHAHTLLWIKDAPKLDVQSDEEICDFIDQHVSCECSDDDPILEEIVQNVQTHKHSTYCRKKGSCRFKYPRPPSPITLIAREPSDDRDDVDDVKSDAKRTLKVVQEILTDQETPSDISMADMFTEAEVDEQDYVEALRISERGNNVVLKRLPSEHSVNPYNPTVLKAWQANIDIQFIIDAYACVMYVAAYMTKSESGMGELLKQTCREYKDQDIKTMLRRLGSVFLNHRELSAQEAAYRILSIPMKKLSRKVLFVNTDRESERTAVLKPKKDLDDKDGDDEDIFQKNIIIRYASRPNSLEDMCLASFAANYATRYNDGEDLDDSVPQVLDEQNEEAQERSYRDAYPKNITLRDDKGRMHKRRREAVIRFRRFNSAKDTSNFYRAKLMLYLPWRDEESDLIGNYTDFSAHYQAIKNVIQKNESWFTENMELIDQAIHENSVNGPPEHMWADIAPGNEHENQQDRDEGIQVERDIEQEDLDANAAMINGPNPDMISDVGARYQAEADKKLIPPKEYRGLIRSLNTKQRDVVFYHRKWCKDAVVAIKQNKPVVPYRLFLSGPGGVGKTHVIRLIHNDTRKFLALSNTIKPSDVTALLTAPTGVASFNIGGMTIHSALLLRVEKYGKGGEPLTFEKLNTLRSKLENLSLLVIDEVSMVGSDMLLNIHKRLCEIKGISGDSALFGNVCVLAVGDLYQLPPVRQSHIFDDVHDSLARINGSLWKDHFMLHELTEVVRQKDVSFSQLLCRVRLGECTEEDLAILQSREISSDDPDYPDDALHVFAFNYDVDKRNDDKLRRLEPNDDLRIVIRATDDKTDSTGLIDFTSSKTSQKRSETAGLHTVLVLAIGARVMLTYNVDTADGLVNGVLGTVSGIIKNTACRVTTVLVKFDNDSVGRIAYMSSQWKQEYPDAVPILRHEGKFEKQGKKGSQIARRQFPLTLAWAVTIHKCQGLTMDEIVVSMKGAKRFGKGQAYVAFSRVKTINGLHITDFDAAGIKTNNKEECEMNEMANNRLCPVPLPKFMNLDDSDWITVGHLNVHYFLEKMNDLNSDVEKEILSKTNVMCFTETYLTGQSNIDDFLNKHNYIAFREDIPDQLNHRGKHGIMICASAALNPKELELIKVNGLESKVVAMQTTMSRFCVAVVYRPPATPMDSFRTKLDDLLSVMPLNVPTVVLGDFNDNILSTRESPLTRLMKRYGFEQCISGPTTDSGSLIDHIYYNRRDDSTPEQLIIDIHDAYYSDHDSVFLTTEYL